MKRWTVMVVCACLLSAALTALLGLKPGPAWSVARETTRAHAAVPAVVSDAQRLRLVPTGHVGGDATAVAVQGLYAYVGFGLDFTVLDVSDPTHPTRAGYLLLNNPIDKIVVQGSRAYALAGKQLHVIDITNPAGPSLMGVYTAVMTTTNFVVSGTLAYVTEYDGLHIVDVANPFQPQEIGALYVPAPDAYEHARAPAVQGHYVYMFVGGAATSWEIWAVDVMNPSVPIKVGSVPAGYDMIIPNEMTVAGNYAYAVGGDQGRDAFEVISVIDPAALSVKSSIEFGAFGEAVAIAVDGTYAYVADDVEARLNTIDISNPLAPTWKASIGGFPAIAISHKGLSFFIAAQSQGLWIVNAKSPISPTISARYATAGYAMDGASLGSNLYVAERGDPFGYSDTQFGGISVLTVTSGGLAPARNIAAESGAAISVADGSAYLAAGNCFRRYGYTLRHLQVFSLADPSNPAWISTVPLVDLFAPYPCIKEETMHLAISSHYAYASLEYEGIKVVDITQPASAMVIGSYIATNTLYYGISLTGTYAYVACGEAGLRVLDVSNPAAPVEAGMLAAADSTRDVVVRGNYAYISDGAAGLRIADVSNPTAPFVVGSVDTPGFAQGIALRDQYAFIADGEAGVRMIDVSNPLAPTEVSAFDTPGNAVNVSVSGDSIFVADGVAGVWRLVVTTNDIFLPLIDR